MDLLSLVLSCSISTSIDDRLIAAIIDQQSFGNPFYVRSEGQPFGVGYETQQAAFDAIERIKKDGKEVYIGLMGVPYNEGDKADIDPKTLFIECNNIAIGTGIIELLSDQCKTEGRRDLATCFIQKYGTKTDRDPTIFVETVIHKSALTRNDKAKSIDENGQIFVQLNDKKSTGNGVYLEYESPLNLQNSDLARPLKK